MAAFTYSINNKWNAHLLSFFNHTLKQTEKKCLNFNIVCICTKLKKKCNG